MYVCMYVCVYVYSITIIVFDHEQILVLFT
jgi:hypothetical protein